jgi:hypothetical protein
VTSFVCFFFFLCSSFTFSVIYTKKQLRTWGQHPMFIYWKTDKNNHCGNIYHLFNLLNKELIYRSTHISLNIRNDKIRVSLWFTKQSIFYECFENCSLLFLLIYHMLIKWAMGMSDQYFNCLSWRRNIVYARLPFLS